MSIMDPIFKVVNKCLIQKKPALKGCYDKSWYFSPEGKKAYESLSSYADKTHFFMNYLRTIERKDGNDYQLSKPYVLYRFAYVMAHSMVDSNLDFGGYPNVLDERKNPLVQYVKHHSLEKGLCKDSRFCFFIMRKFGEKSISFCGENQPITDMYKIERDIIFMFDKDSHQSGSELPKAYMDALEDVMRLDHDLYDEGDIDDEE